ncbi:MAG: helix-turn-helix domain-containing protein [Terrimesophilobacter sp.]
MLRDKASELIKAAREDASMTQSALARAAGIHQPTLAAYESGRRNPRLDTLRMILRAAGTRPSVPLELFADEIIERGLRHGLTNIRVFGSPIRGDDTEHSDIDLLVRTADSVSLFDLGAFAMEVEELTSFAVDLLTEEQANNPHFAHVLDEAVPL